MEMTTEAALQKGITAQNSGQIQLADRCYTAILQVQPKHPDANHNMGVLAVSIGKVQEALPFFKTALKVEPSASRYWLSYTDALIRLGQLFEARAVFNEARSIGAKGEAFDKLEANLVALEKTGHEVSSLTDESSKVPSANILDNLKLDQALTLAKQNAKDGKYEDARNIYQDIIKKFPGNKKAASALKLLSEGAVKNSKDPPPEVCSSIINLFTQGQFQQALNEAEKILQTFQNSAFLHNIIGASYAGLRNFVAAIASYKKALKINPNYADACYSMGVALREQDDFTAAILSYKQALKIKPDYIEAHLNLGKIFKDQGDIETSILSYKKAIKINPALTEAHYNMGNALKEKGNLDAAIASYNKALKLNADFTEAHSNMGLALAKRGDLDAAIDSYRRALKINPDYADAFNNMGIALAERGDIETSILSYNQAIKINPALTEAYYNMGNTLTKRGDLDAALDSYRRALKINPEYVHALNNMGIALAKRGDLDAALDSYRRALKINPDYADALNNIGLVLMEKGDLDAALDSYRRVLKINPDYVDAFNNIGIALMEKGDLDAAIDSYQRALKINVNHIDCFMNLSSLKVQLSELSCKAVDPNKNTSDVLCNMLSQNPKHQINQAIFNFLNGNLKRSGEYLKKYNVLTTTPCISTLEGKDKSFCDAYFSFLNRLIKNNKTTKNSELPAIYHIGESHCLSYANTIMLKNKNPYYVLPKITFGAKAYHFSNQIENIFKSITRFNLKTIPRGAPVLISFGEIDCRINEGFIKASEKNGRKISELVDETVEGYVSWFLNENIANQHSQYFFNVPAPAYFPEFSEDFNNKKAEVVSQFNATLSKKLQNLDAMMIDVYEYTRNDKGFSNGQYHCDGVHLDARIIAKIENQINP